MASEDSKVNRREFLQKSAVVAAGSAALSHTALSYARIVGPTIESRLAISASAIVEASSTASSGA